MQAAARQNVGHILSSALFAVPRKAFDRPLRQTLKEKKVLGKAVLAIGARVAGRIDQSLLTMAQDDIFKAHQALHFIRNKNLHQSRSVLGALRRFLP